MEVRAGIPLIHPRYKFFMSTGKLQPSFQGEARHKFAWTRRKAGLADAFSLPVERPSYGTKVETQKGTSLGTPNFSAWANDYPCADIDLQGETRRSCIAHL